MFIDTTFNYLYMFFSIPIPIGTVHLVTPLNGPTIASA